VGRDGQDRVRHSRLSARRPGAVNLTPLIAVAHGSKDPRAAATIGELISQVRSRAATRDLAGLDVKAAFLDHCAPSLPQVLGAVGAVGALGALGALGAPGAPGAPGSVADAAECVVVPLLLTAAYHSKTDIPARLAAGVPAGLAARYAGTLGPHPLLLTALERRLAEAGLGLTAGDRQKTSVVLAAAGSSDPRANAAVAALAARWQARGGWRRVVPAYASAAGPSPGEAVRALRASVAHSPVAVASYLLAPGYFADKVRDAALEAGADVVSAALGAAPEVADVILHRYQEARRAGDVARIAVGAGLSVPIVARAQLSRT
jgi:sirohydrochlorin ferrochelatase